MPKPFSEYEKESIRGLLFEKGIVLFEKFGIRKTTVDDLALAAGISKGAFYIFFPSKEELLMQILEHFEQDVQTRFLNLAVQTGADAKEKISSLLKDTLLTWERYPLLTRMVQADYEYLIRKLPPGRIKQHVDHDQEFVDQFLQKAQSEGIDIHVSPHLVAGLFKSLFFISLHKDDLGEESYKESVEVLVDLVAGYVTKENE
jgi:AcrR family transcriptional regulator